MYLRRSNRDLAPPTARQVASHASPGQEQRRFADSQTRHSRLRGHAGATLLAIYDAEAVGDLRVNEQALLDLSTCSYLEGIEVSLLC